MTSECGAFGSLHRGVFPSNTFQITGLVPRVDQIQWQAISYWCHVNRLLHLTPLLLRRVSALQGPSSGSKYGNIHCRLNQNTYNQQRDNILSLKFRQHFSAVKQPSSGQSRSLRSDVREQLRLRLCHLLSLTNHPVQTQYTQYTEYTQYTQYIQYKPYT